MKTLLAFCMIVASILISTNKGGCHQLCNSFFIEEIHFDAIIQQVSYSPNVITLKAIKKTQPLTSFAIDENFIKQISALPIGQKIRVTTENNYAISFCILDNGDVQ